MSIRGEIIIECDSEDCHAEIICGPWALMDFALGDLLADDGWEIHAKGRVVCPDCAKPENPRERGDDDGVEYADPRDAKADRI